MEARPPGQQPPALLPYTAGHARAHAARAIILTTLCAFTVAGRGKKIEDYPTHLRLLLTWNDTAECRRGAALPFPFCRALPSSAGTVLHRPAPCRVKNKPALLPHHRGQRGLHHRAVPKGEQTGCLPLRLSQDAVPFIARKLSPGCQAVRCCQVICRYVGQLSGTVRCLCQTSCQVLSVLSGAVGCVSDRRGDL